MPEDTYPQDNGSRDDGGPLEPLPIPEKLTKTWTDDDWNELSPSHQAKIVEAENRKASAHREQVERLHGTIGELKGRLESLEARSGERDGTGKSPTSWKDYDDGTWEKDAQNAMDLFFRKIREPDNEDLQQQTANLNASTILQIVKEQSRRAAEKAKQDLTQEFTAKERQNQASQRMIQDLTAQGLSQTALANPDDPVYQKKDEYYRKLVQMNGGEQAPILEYAAYLAALEAAKKDSPRRTDDASRRLDVSQLLGPRNTADFEDREVSALRKQGKTGQALQKRLRNFLSASNPQPVE